MDSQMKVVLIFVFMIIASWLVGVWAGYSLFVKKDAETKIVNLKKDQQDCSLRFRPPLNHTNSVIVYMPDGFRIADFDGNYDPNGVSYLMFDLVSQP